MKQILLLSAATFALAACARTEPIPENALDDVTQPSVAPEDLISEQPTPELTPGMEWDLDRSANAATFGADSASPALSVGCNVSGSERTLELARYFPTVPSGAGTMTLTGNGAIATVPVSAEANDGRPGGRLTATLDIGDLAGSVGKVLRGENAINVSVTGAEPLVLMSGSDVRGVLDQCLGAAGTDGDAEATDDREIQMPVASEPVSN